MGISGPVFLLIYLLLAVLANLLYRWFIRYGESASTVKRLEFAHDPYQIAFLREGVDEAVKVAAISLIDRDLLQEKEGQIRRINNDAIAFAARPIEKALLQCFGDWGWVSQAPRDARVKAACRAYEEHLKKTGLLASTTTLVKRFPAFAAVTGVMLGIVAARIHFTVLKGGSNFAFLIILAVGCVIGLWLAYRERITGLGDATLGHLKTLFLHLEARASKIRAKEANHDAALVAALFGADRLSAIHFPYIERLYPKPKAGDSSDGGSSSDDGGGGCGGGGCGGGCG